MNSRVALSVLIMAFAIAAGCQNTGPDAVSATQKTGSSYLIATMGRLPAVKAIEKWENAYGDGLVITTEHYTIRTTLTDALILRLLPAFVESAYEGYQNELPETITTRNSFDLYLFAKRQQWEAFTNDFVGPESQLYKKIQKGAYCAKGACVAYYIGRNETFSAVGHEGWHQFCGRHFVYRLPSWLDEGIATLFETSSFKDGTWTFEPQVNLGRLGGLKRTLLDGHAMPLSTLLSLNPGQVIGGHTNTVAFYSQSYALVRFLREDGYGRRLDRFHALLLGGLRGDWPLSDDLRRIAADRNVRLTASWNAMMGPRLFEQYITPDLPSIEQEYMNFCRKITYHVRLRQIEVPVDVEQGS